MYVFLLDSLFWTSATVINISLEISWKLIQKEPEQVFISFVELLMYFVLYSNGCCHLEYICIAWCHRVTDSGIEHLARHCTKLRTFICKGALQVHSVFCPLCCLEKLAFQAYFHSFQRNWWVFVLNGTVGVVWYSLILQMHIFHFRHFIFNQILLCFLHPLYIYVYVFFMISAINPLIVMYDVCAFETFELWFCCI